MTKEEIAKVLEKIEVVRECFDQLSHTKNSISIKEAQEFIEKLEEIENAKN